jgi:hypothetical protein
LLSPNLDSRLGSTSATSYIFRNKEQNNKARTLREDRKAMMREEERRTSGAVEDAGEYE